MVQFLLVPSSPVCISSHVSSFPISDVSTISLYARNRVSDLALCKSVVVLLLTEVKHQLHQACVMRGRYLSQINGISRSSDLYHDPFDNWYFYKTSDD